MRISAAFSAIADLALARGIRNIKDTTEAVKIAVDERWSVWLSGAKPLPETKQHPAIPSFHAYVEFNGFPAGLLNPAEGAFAAGRLANEDAFIVALRQAQQRANPSTAHLPGAEGGDAAT